MKALKIFWLIFTHGLALTAFGVILVWLALAFINLEFYSLDIRGWHKETRGLLLVAYIFINLMLTDRDWETSKTQDL